MALPVPWTWACGEAGVLSIANRQDRKFLFHVQVGRVAPDSEKKRRGLRKNFSPCLIITFADRLLFTPGEGGGLFLAPTLLYCSRDVFCPASMRPETFLPSLI